MRRPLESSPVNRRTFLVLALVAASATWAMPAHAQGSVEGVASQLICMCGCGKLLNVCEMDTARQIRSIIGEKLALGWGSADVITYMTETYGERVLAAPTKRGFNLTAWITPFALILAGGAVLLMAVSRWVRAQRARPALVGGEILSELEARYGALLDREIENTEV